MTKYSLCISLRCNLLLICIAGLVVAQTPDATQALGIVTDIRGKWVNVREQRTIERTDEVFAHTTVSADRSTGGSIQVNLFDGSVWIKKCSKIAPCEGSYAIKGKSEPTEWRGLAPFFLKYFAAGEKMPAIFAAARSVGGDLPRVSVVSLSGGRVDLAPALSTMRPGRWKVMLSDPSKFPGEGVSQVITLPGPAILSERDFAQGVLALDVETERGDPIGAPTAVLVTSGPFTEEAMAEFAKAEELAGSWDNVDASTIRLFLIRALYSIEALRRP